MINKKISNNNKNLGLELLRMIFSYFIVVVHCCYIKNRFLYKLLINKPFHISFFLLTSFYFSYNTFISKNILKIKLRFVRILVPYIIWPIIFYIINNTFYIFFRFSIYKRKLLFKQLIIQIILGRNYHGVFWFQFNLIFISLLFAILSFIFLKKNFLIILQIIGIFAYYLQYYSLNYKFFFSYNDNLRYSVGSIAEMLPIAVTGVVLSSINLIEKLRVVRKQSLLFIIIIFILIFDTDVIISPKGFFYPGILINIGAILFFSFFGLILINESLNKKLILIISYITSFTGGVYYLHTVIRNILIPNISLVKYKTYLGALIIYITCFLICLIGNKILGKTKLKYLFY